ncbi:MAG: restriction endonuclease subunit S [Gomphosphaeria aponina SAG 52.96 = DSM 107014]|uniref:Restriction endonuclease subunit S n=1 Tax=Gomphosphaeria aponina SAG 52.96 = DSM 107014 TaxID=1521640 RepID=A0A941GRB9_9CHRO|nr:restriction endonuclease subunit S [Gomphosphaeria aponina SAG 52.96 = DSM 107014]
MRYKYPSEWKVSLLDDVTIRGSGHTPSQSNPDYWNGGIKWVSLADSSKLDNLFIANTDKEISDLGLENSSAVKHPAGTVILSRDAGIGKSAILKEDMAVSQHFIVWKCSSKKIINNFYLYYWLQMMKPEFERMAVGSTVKTIGLPYFKKLKIAYPPLPEQRKIADILGTWDKAIALLEQLITAKRKLKRGLMQQLLTGKKRFKEFEGSEWKKVHLSNLCSLITKGTTPTSVGFEFSSAGVNYIKIESITEDGQFIPEKFAKISQKAHNALKRSQLEESDILFSIAGALGRVAIVNQHTLPANTNQALAIIRLGKKNKICHRYLFQYLKSELIVKHIVRINVQAAQANLSLAQLNDFEIILPSLPEQEKIAAILSTADDEISTLEKKLAAYKQQKRGLMQQLLTGKKRVKL